MARPIGVSGTAHLQKHHRRGCKNRGDLTKCDCPAWYGSYGGFRQTLSVWAGHKIDPRSKSEATKVLNRFKAAIDNHEYDPAGERPKPTGSDHTLAAFIDEWQTHYAEEYGLTGTGLPYQLGVIQAGKLGGLTLDQLAGSSQFIAQWLTDTGKMRGWSNKTWNSYHQILFSLCDRATRWKTDGVPRMTENPMRSIDRKVVMEGTALKEYRILEDVEDRLFAVVEQLNRCAYIPNKQAKLTREQADTIRARVARGERQYRVAAAHGVSAQTVSEIVNGESWTDHARRLTTRGTEMRRRLIGAFDAGLRAGEMQRIRLPHVQWQRPVPLVAPDGTRFHGYEIHLPPEITKGGQTTGKIEVIFVGTLRMARMLEERRFQLKRINDPLADFIFGYEDGRRQVGFKKGWHDLFRLAGLDYGRDKGLVWHSTRHEYISRLAEDTANDDTLVQELARHKDPRTTQRYRHARNDRKWTAVVGLNRAKNR